MNPDVEKSIPVISLASGRVVGIYAKLGDDVKKGQLLLKVLSNDIATAFQDLQPGQSRRGAGAQAIGAREAPV